MSEENLKKLKELKEKIIQREFEEKDITLFIKSFIDYYYNDYQLIFNNLEDFHNIIVLLLEEIEDFIFNHKSKENLDKYEINFYKISKMDIKNKLELLKSFYQKFNININLDEIINNGILNIITIDLEEAIDKDLILSGLCGIDENDKKHIEIKVYNTGLITDIFIWAHEIAHYQNLTNPRSETNLLLTESISYTHEMLLLDYLSDLGFSYEASTYQFEILREFQAILYQAYYVIKLYIVYDKLGDITIENYKQIFGYDDDYDTCLNNFYDAIKKKLTAIFSLTYYSIASALAPYMYYEWEKDEKFILQIEKFSENIMNMPLIPSLNTIGITGLDEQSIEKVKKAISNYKEEIVNGNDYILTKCARINEYFIELTLLFYNDKRLIFDKINDIFYLNSYLKELLTNYFKETFPFNEIDKQTKMTKEEKIRIIMDYYKYLNYDIDMGDLINNVIFDDIKKEDLEEELEEDAQNLTHYCLVGYNTDESGYNEININNTPYLLDTPAWIHEFRHHLNHPGHKRNQESCSLTEVCSFIDELIFADYLNKIGYTYESAYIKFETLNTLYIQILDAYSINKLLNVFVKIGDVSKENYQKLYQDDEFENTIDEAETLLYTDTDNFLDGIRYTIAAALSIYMYEKYKKDPSYLKTIKEFEAHINDGDFYKSLSIIGITGIDNESLIKVNKALNLFELELNDYLNQDLVKIYDINLQKIIKRN